MSTPVAFTLMAELDSKHDSVKVWVYSDQAGSRSRSGQLKLSYGAYASFARYLGGEAIAKADLPVRDESRDLAATIAADAADALKGISLVQIEGGLVDEWNNRYPAGTHVQYWVMTTGDAEGDDDCASLGATLGRAFMLGNRAYVNIADFAMPVALSHVRPMPQTTPA